jgi:hypothetical protein
MGLDMYAFRVRAEDALGDFEIAKTDDESRVECEEIMYWRKHHDLHGWMEQLYRAKGGTKESFNCVPVRLTMEDLQDLEKDVLADNLPQTQGFFFGDNPPDEESMLHDMEFISKAKVAIARGDAIYYDSWW